MNRRKIRIFTFTTLGVLILLTFIFFIWIEISMTPIAMSMAEARVMSIATKALNEAVAQSMSDVSYMDLVQIEYDSDNRVSAMQANTVYMNNLATQTALIAQGKIAEITNQRVSIPLGSALGSQLLSGKGPNISAYATPVGAVTSQFLSEFTSAGINQTIHRLYIKLTASMSVIMPSHSSALTATTLVPVAETVIIGAVPGTFLQTLEEGDMLNLLP
ncbi:MAG: sporulation protein YunB [Christensenellales bacterium]|jgi:sporulation protein YunB